MTNQSRPRAVVALITFLSLLGITGTVGASDVELGSPTTLEELLASPEYLPEHADIARLYRAFFDRQPDVDGLAYWIDVYEDGADLIDLSWAFSSSIEFQTLYGADLNNSRFLEVVYANVLGRSYDQDGFDYWLNSMDEGLPRHETVYWIVEGQEFKTLHPFAGTFPAIEAALLTSADMPSSYTEYSAGRGTETAAQIADWHLCDQWRTIHSNALHVYLGEPDGSEFVLQDAYAFSNVADASKALTDIAVLPVNCGSRVLSFESGESLLIRYHTESDFDFETGIGDEAVVVRGEWKWRNGPTYDYYLWVVRDGTVITVTDATTRYAIPDYIQSRRYAITTSERMRELLDLD